MRIGVVVDYGDSSSALELLEHARAAERQGFDAIWLGDHLMSYGEPTADGPFESVTLMAAIAAVTERVRLGWGMLNPGFRPPAVLAKMLATLDHISRGRIICSLGLGAFEEEYEAYRLPFPDHGERAAYAREVAELLRELWTHPAPERVTFDGRFVQTRELPLSPAPFQRPHPPIWFGGDSEATIGNVKSTGDGWVANVVAEEQLAGLRAQPDWPSRPIDLVWSTSVAVAHTEEEALVEARKSHASLSARLAGRFPPFEMFLQGIVVGTPEQCAARLEQVESWGVGEILCPPRDAAHQQRIADLLLPQLRRVSQPA